MSARIAVATTNRPGRRRSSRSASLTGRLPRSSPPPGRSRAPGEPRRARWRARAMSSSTAQNEHRAGVEAQLRAARPSPARPGEQERPERDARSEHDQRLDEQRAHEYAGGSPDRAQQRQRARLLQRDDQKEQPGDERHHEANSRKMTLNELRTLRDAGRLLRPHRPGQRVGLGRGGVDPLRPAPARSSPARADPDRARQHSLASGLAARDPGRRSRATRRTASAAPGSRRSGETDDPQLGAGPRPRAAPCHRARSRSSLPTASPAAPGIRPAVSRSGPPTDLLVAKHGDAVRRGPGDCRERALSDPARLPDPVVPSIAPAAPE